MVPKFHFVLIFRFHNVVKTYMTRMRKYDRYLSCKMDRLCVVWRQYLKYSKRLHKRCQWILCWAENWWILRNTVSVVAEEYLYSRFSSGFFDRWTTILHHDTTSSNYAIVCETNIIRMPQKNDHVISSEKRTVYSNLFSPLQNRSMNETFKCG